MACLGEGVSEGVGLFLGVFSELAVYIEGGFWAAFLFPHLSDFFPYFGAVFGVSYLFPAEAFPMVFFGLVYNRLTVFGGVREGCPVVFRKVLLE